MQSSWNPPASQVDYRAIRDLLRTGKLAAASDAHLTPPPPLHSQAHVFRAPPGPPQPAHPDVWGSEQHPYDSKPEGELVSFCSPLPRCNWCSWEGGGGGGSSVRNGRRQWIANP